MFYEPILEAYLYINVGLHDCMMKITGVHGYQKNTVKKKISVKKMVTTKTFGLVTSWHLTKKVKFELCA